MIRKRGMYHTTDQFRVDSFKNTPPSHTMEDDTADTPFAP